MSALTDPCLPDSWNVYGAYAGLFAMLAALGMQLIEFLANQRLRSAIHKHTHLTAHIDATKCNHEHTHDEADESTDKKITNNETDKFTCVEHVHHENEKPKKKIYVNGTTDNIKNIERTNDETEENEKVEQAIETNRKSEKRKSVNNEINNLENMEQNNNKTEEPGQMQQTNDKTEKAKEKKTTHKKHKNSKHMEEAPNEIQVPEKNDHIDCVTVEIVHIEPTPEAIDFCEGSGHHHGAAFQDNDQHHAISTYLLELGIALHSVLIGLTLGTTTDSFVALFFHQFFEAIALGAQIANLKNLSIISAIGMVVFYALTTPVGIAIGIGIHSGIYNPKSVTTLLVTGILDSLAAGVLIYVALVNLITAEMSANAYGFYSLRTRLKLLYYTALYLGVAAMAVIGRWA
jgi:zinc transporter ZupT